MIRREICEGWRVTELRSVTPGNTDGVSLGQASRPGHRNLPWMPASVPGHVHLDLMEAGVICDPFYRLNERGVEWVDETDWVYETRFHVESLVTDNVYLLFHGLDTIAEIYLNGLLLGCTDNMYIPHEFLVGDKLNAGHGADGENILRVVFEAAYRIGSERYKAWDDAGNPSMPGHWDVWDARAFVRKAQYMFGWDWGPVLNSCGIWKPVELAQIPVARFLDYRYEVLSHNSDRAVVEVEAFIERAPSALGETISMLLKIDGGTPITASVNVPEGSGRIGCKAVVTIENARLWQPNGLGDQSLYPVEIELKGDGFIDRMRGNIGIRTIELLCEPDADGIGEGFKFRVNGADLFIKGANWIPSYSFPSHEKIGNLLKDARDAGFNMLRVWGGGLYESEEFYRQCDHYGIMVWQDFPYACSFYPDIDEYADAARHEAEIAVRRLRSHPSLAVWCGNNEIDAMYRTSKGNLPPRFVGEPIFHEILPDVVAKEDPGRIYRPSSPFGGEDPNASNIGDHHNWDIWQGKGDWIHYADCRSRFASEFGFAASCGLAAWKTCLADDDRSARSTAVRWHDKTRLGYDNYLRLIRLHFPDPETLEDMVYYSQLNQAEALKFGIEHCRRIKGTCWGTLFWQFNDCWPAHTWAVIDSAHDRKAAYFACKRFYAPVLLSLVRSGNTVEAHIVNDRQGGIEGKLVLSLKGFDGSILAQERMTISAGANSAAMICRFEIGQSKGIERQVYVHGALILCSDTEESAATENILFLSEPKELEAPETYITADISDLGGERMVVTLSTESFAPYVWLRLKDDAILDIEDNFFHLQPGERRSLIITKSVNVASAGELREQLIISALNVWQGDAAGSRLAGKAM